MADAAPGQKRQSRWSRAATVLFGLALPAFVLFWNSPATSGIG